MSINETLKKYSEITEGALDRLLPEDDYCGFGIVNEAMRYSLMSGGKRIRPFLVLEICRVCGGDISRAVEFACALEMVHTYSLIHDDLPCMDNDDMRRGKPSCHIRFGEDIALLAGDALLTKSFGVAAQSKCPNEGIVRAVSVLSRFAGESGMIGGQMVDLQTEGKKVSEKTLYSMIAGKTCALFRAAAALGCIAAGVYEGETFNRFDEFALNFGMAFQIVDDILDVVGDSKILGKNTGSDQNNEKSNFVTVLGPEMAKQMAAEHNDKAVDVLKKIDGTDVIVQLCDYLISRTF
ncbi:MAG: polyprenyl synthetase family protein [Clostridia bacterium]|nr:polyprenyl synthetase family protein [Clostridia bacterium]